MSYVITSATSGHRAPRGRARLNRSSPFARGMVGLWAGFDDPYALTIHDSTDHGNDAAWSTTYEGPLFSTSAKFQSRVSQLGDGADATIDGATSVGVIPQLQGATHATLMTWVRRGAASKYAGVGYGADASNRFHVTGWTSALVYGAKDAAFNSTSLNDTLWHHFAITFDADIAAAQRVAVYIDGVFKMNVNTSSASLSSSASNRLRLGMGVPASALDANNFSQWIDARAYDRALSAQEIAANYLRPFDVYATSLRRTYFIPEAAGGTTYDRESAEVLDFADADTRNATFARDIAEAIALVDATSRTAAFERVVAESLALVDETARAGIFERSSADALTLTDETLQILAGIERDSADTITITDATTFSAVYARTVAETLDLVDASTRVAVFARLVAEALTVIDATDSTGGESVAVETKGGHSMTLRQMRALERQQLLAMIREDDEIIIALVADLLAKGRRLN